MATVQELSVLHRRYSDISHRFRAAWTFHQFFQSLAKTLLQRADDGRAGDFQRLYTELKEISQSLNASEGDRVRGRLERVDREISDLIGELAEEDTRVSPELMRQFFRRVKGYDEKILTQLVKFYLYAHPGDSWEPDRLDKVDFLLTRLSEEEMDTGELMLSDPRRLGEIFSGLAALVGEGAAPEVVQQRRLEIEAVRSELSRIESLDDLNESGLIPRYRDLKHGLGAVFFEPGLLISLLETNLALRNRIQKLYGREERRIAAEYQRIFELEREVSVDTELDRELAQFREEIERFEKQLQRQEFKLGDLAQIRQRVRALLPRLTAGRPELSRGTAVGGTRPGLDSGEYRIVAAAAAASSQLPVSHREDVIGEHFRRLVDALKEMNPDLAPERVVLTPEIYPLRLEAREVLAYHRYYGRKECDRPLEHFVLEAAALRIRINEEAHEITGILDETSVTGSSPIYVQARQTARTADEYLWRFSHVLHEALLAGNAEDAVQLDLLRMRLMRDYSGLWLLAYKPFITRRPGHTVA